MNITTERKMFPSIGGDAFAHPLDKAALSTLEQIPGFGFTVRKFFEYGLERYLYAQNIADNIRVGAKQVPKIYRLFKAAVEILDFPEPELYIDQDPVVNAFTFGSEKPFIVLHSGLIDLLDDRELQAVIGHELGHIKCGHTLYKTIALLIGTATQLLGQLTFGVGKGIGQVLELALHEWSRKSELSGNRAALLGTQDPDVVVNMLMKLAGGCRTVYEQIDRKEFMKQAEGYQEMDRTLLDRGLRLWQNLNRTHPFPLLRAKEIESWAQSDEYRCILSGQYPRETKQTAAKCPQCGNPKGAKAVFCHNCGASLGPPSDQECQGCKTPIPKGASFCPNCGQKVVSGVAEVVRGLCPSCGGKTEEFYLFCPPLRHCASANGQSDRVMLVACIFVGLVVLT